MMHAILTAIGADRPGLVDEVSEFIFARGGNIEDSRMVNLRGQFAMMVLIGAAEQTISRLRSEIWQLQQQSGLQIELRPATAATGASAPACASGWQSAVALIRLLAGSAREPWPRKPWPRKSWQ